MFPIGLQLDFFEKKQKNLSYMEPFNLETEKEIFNMVFGIKTIKAQSKKRRQPKNLSKKLK
jgi:hypothetical protein